MPGIIEVAAECPDAVTAIIASRCSVKDCPNGAGIYYRSKEGKFVGYCNAVAGHQAHEDDSYRGLTNLLLPLSSRIIPWHKP